MTEPIWKKADLVFKMKINLNGVNLYSDKLNFYVNLAN